eukprot:TRINITY_DN2955_c1_g1_i1.p1 TRINITY_DN2955_c1_g1~~TRINITY_DN2955_c1_g1_i1.p1  ORF type:complete len:593 (+),score=37.58 TRINITY_DN2955_c1_g1_i1:44-1780(+)
MALKALLLGLLVIKSADAQSCRRQDLIFTRWPLDGVNGRDYFTTNYVDLDRDGNELRDYTGRTGGTARTYDQHRGLDTGIANFRRMDNGQAKIRAAAGGTVTTVVENQPDRNSVWCPNLDPADVPSWNVVVITATNGWRVIYGHLKRNSATVSVGDNVSPGQIIGVVGSSGCSTDPHLHFEVRDCSNNFIETHSSGWFVPDMWNPSPPSYNPTSNVMDLMLKSGDFSSTTLRDPPNDVKVMSTGSRLGIGVVYVGVAGDVLNIRVYNSEGLRLNINENVSGSRKRRLRKGWWAGINNVVGQWRVEVRMNSVLRRVKQFMVSSYPTFLKEVVVRRVRYQDYQGVFNDVTAAGYRPEFTDGYNHGNQGYLNAVFRPNNGAYISSSRLTPAQYQNRFDTRPSGWRPVLVESYLHSGVVRYALILKPKVGGQWTAFHGRTRSQWISLFNSLRSSGYSPIQISVVSVGGDRFYTSYWEKRNIGTWYVHTTLRVSHYQGVYNYQTGVRNRRPMYLNAYRHNGVNYVSVIFASSVPAVHQARHNIGTSALDSTKFVNNLNNRLTNALTGYMSGSNHRYGAVWWDP